MTKKRLVSELLHYMEETEKLRSIRTRLEIELSKTKDELERYRKCWEESCYSTDELSIPLERV